MNILHIHANIRLIWSEMVKTDSALLNTLYMFKSNPNSKCLSQKSQQKMWKKSAEKPCS